MDMTTLISQTVDIATPIIANFEGFRAKAYLCPAKVWTVGHGFATLRGRPVRSTDVINEHDSRLLLRKKVTEFATAVIRPQSARTINDLDSKAFAALTSLAFNIGVAAFSASTLQKLLSSRKYQEAAKQFDRWVFANSVRLPGLVTRRAREKALFLSGIKSPGR